MVTTNKSLLSLTAADVMSHTVVMVPQEMSLASAARMLSQARVSGAPVVDAEGRCVGVLSATDYVHWAEKKPQPPCPCEESAIYSWQIVDNGALPRDAVRHHMTSDPVTTSASAGVGELAQRMLDAHIHRIIVVDEGNRPVGIVSSTDLLAAIAHAARSAEVAAKSGRPALAVG